MFAFTHAAAGMSQLVRLRRRLRGPRRSGWNVRYETVAALLQLYGRTAAAMPIWAQRRLIEGLSFQSDVAREAVSERVRASGVVAEWIRMPESDPERVLLYLHGGGYVLGSVRTHRDAIARFCRASAAVAFAPEYRLAPEHRFPAQVDDAVAVYRHLLAMGFSPARIVIAGESAGGGLTVATLVKLRDEGLPLPAAGVALSPWTDMDVCGSTLLDNAHYDFLQVHHVHQFVELFVAPAERRHPLASPLHADLTGLPPLLVQAGGAEILLDDARRLAERARAHGVEVTLEVWDDMFHAWQLFGAVLPEARQATEAIGAFVRAHTPQPTAR